MPVVAVFPTRDRQCCSSGYSGLLHDAECISNIGVSADSWIRRHSRMLSNSLPGGSVIFLLKICYKSLNTINFWRKNICFVIRLFSYKTYALYRTNIYPKKSWKKSRLTLFGRACARFCVYAQIIVVTIFLLLFFYGLQRWYARNVFGLFPRLFRSWPILCYHFGRSIPSTYFSYFLTATRVWFRMTPNSPFYCAANIPKNI